MSYCKGANNNTICQSLQEVRTIARVWWWKVSHATIKCLYAVNCKDNVIKHFLCRIAREATANMFLMLQEALYCQGAYKDNKPTMARSKDTTIRFFYVVDYNDHGNKLVLQEATTRIIFSMSWYCTTRLIAARKWEIPPRNNRHSLSWCWNDQKDCNGGAKAPMTKDVWDCHRRGYNGQDFYIISQGSTMMVDHDKRARSRQGQPTFFIDVDQPHQQLQRRKAPVIILIATMQQQFRQRNNHFLLSYPKEWWQYRQMHWKNVTAPTQQSNVHVVVCRMQWRPFCATLQPAAQTRKVGFGKYIGKCMYIA